MQKNINTLTLKLFWSHIRNYKRLWIPLLFGVPVAVLLMEFFQPYLASRVLEGISTQNYDPNNLLGSFSTELILYAISVFVSGVAAWRFNVWLVWQLDLNVSRDISNQVFKHLMKMSSNFHANSFGGSLVSQTNKLVGAYMRLLDSTVFSLYTLIIAMTATMVILAPRVPIYAGALLLLSIVYIIGTIYFSKGVRDANRKEAAAQSKGTGNLADSITNVMAVKSFAASKHEEKRYWKTISATRAAGLESMRATTKRETYSSVVTSTIGIVALLVAVLGVQYFEANIGTLFLIVSYTGSLGSRLWEFQNVLRQYNRAFGDASNMVSILQIEPDVKDAANPEKVRINRGLIELKDVGFQHDGGKEALFNSLNLRIKPGEKIGLVGHSGSGKTTLTKLLLRFSDIDSGEILIDGQNITHITQDDLRRHISYVPQEPLLFHRSLSENIAYGNPKASQAEIEAISRKANTHDFIKDLPDGYKTLVGERGVKLSGGQRQRVAIARAMLKNAPILVLDEATSALDSESEALIQDALWKLMEGRTAIVIAHRLSTIQKMDRIVVMDNGNIIEEGSHKELIRKNGKYAELWNRQSGGFIED